MENPSTSIENFWKSKKETFILSRLWEDEVKIKLSRFKRFLEHISSYIFKKASIGKETTIAIAKFLKDHASADKSYASQLENQTIYLPSNVSQNSSNTLKSSLALMSQSQSYLSQQFKNLSQSIEK